MSQENEFANIPDGYDKWLNEAVLAVIQENDKLIDKMGGANLSFILSKILEKCSIVLSRKPDHLIVRFLMHLPQPFQENDISRAATRLVRKELLSSVRTKGAKKIRRVTLYSLKKNGKEVKV